MVYGEISHGVSSGSQDMTEESRDDLDTLKMLLILVA